MDIKKLRTYAHLKNTAKGLEEKATGMKKEIEQEMEAEEIREIKDRVGLFQLKERVFYTYSKKVEEKEKELEELKRKEREKNMAIEKLTRYLYFKSK